MLLDAELRAAWKGLVGRGPVQGSIVLCENARDTADHDGAQYQGSEWARTLQGCLVAWAATGDASFAKTAIRFYDALLDDLDRVGDRLGGDKAATRDSGYAIRNLGPWTALAYDWLHDKLSEEQRAKARKRWAAWLAWYKDNGYRARVPGSNYQAGYLVAATLIAVAQGGEAGEEGTKLWRYVADELWNKDMKAALAPGGILEGGDWPEGWQYGPLSVTSYALAARVARRAGIPVEGVDRWLDSLLKRHVYALSPADRNYPGGDTEDDQANLPVAVNTLNAMSLGDASPDTKRWAKGELSRLKLMDKDSLLHDALATVGAQPALVPRATWPTWYLAAGTSTLYARSRWDEQAVWFVAECSKTLGVDHRNRSTGTFALSRGKDDVIVDPSPYGSASTLTSNAPTVESGHLPDGYKPSQGAWGENSGWRWATQTRSGVVAARCDYADQYKFQDRPSDVPEALRDFVLLPSTDGTEATLLVIDRADTASDKRAMYLRFRIPAVFALEGDVARTQIGGTKLAVTSVMRSGGTISRATPRDGKDCFGEGVQKGKCDAARFPVTDLRIVVPGAKPRAVHAIAATVAAKPTQAKLGGATWAGVQVGGVREAVVVWPTTPGSAFDYAVPRGATTHVILDVDKPAVTAKLAGETCAVSVKSGGDGATPAIVTLDASCNVVVDPPAAGAAPTGGIKPSGAPRPPATTKRSGCCAAQTTPPTSSLVMTLVVGLFLLRSRRSRR